MRYTLAREPLSLILLVDFENWNLQSTGIERMLLDWLKEAPLASTETCLVRLYGGWWDGDNVSRRRSEVSAFVSGEKCPALVRVGSAYCRIRYEFADTLLNEQRSRIRHTFAHRPAQSLSFGPRGGASCTVATCTAKSLREWVFSRRACTAPGCGLRFGDMWHRAEQKQVDVHIAVDLLLLRQGSPKEAIAVASNDLDLLPAVISAVASGGIDAGPISVLREKGRSTYLDASLESAGVQLVYCN